MNKTKNALITTVALITLQATPGWSEPYIKAEQSNSLEEINRLKRNIEENYRDIKSINDLGVIYLKQGKYDQAIAQFKKALKVSPVYTIGPVLSGNIYTDAEHHQNKVKEFQRIIKENREYARAHNYLGLAYLQQKNYSTAKTSLLESIKINPKYAKAHNNLGVLYEELGETAKAIESYQTANRIDPSDPDSLYNLGLAYDSMEDGGKSLHYLVLAKKAREKKPGQNDINRINEKIDRLWAKYADNKNSESVASLDSKIKGNAGTPIDSNTNQTLNTSSSFTPLKNQETSLSSSSSIAYQTPKALTVNLKPQLDLSSTQVTPVANISSEQDRPIAVDENGDLKNESAHSPEDIAAFPDKGELTADVKIEERTFMEPDSKGVSSSTLSESEEKVETASSSKFDKTKKVANTKPEKKTWVSDWVFEYPK